MLKPCLPISAYSNKKNRTTLFLLVRFDHENLLDFFSFEYRKIWKHCFCWSVPTMLKPCLLAYSNKKNRTTLFLLVRFADHVKQCLPISAYSNKKNRTTLFLLVRFADHVKQCLPISAYSNKKNRTTLFLLVRFADHVKQCLPISAYSNKKNRTTLFLLVRFADHVKQCLPMLFE